MLGRVLMIAAAMAAMAASAAAAVVALAFALYALLRGPLGPAGAAACVAAAAALTVGLAGLIVALTVRSSTRQAQRKTAALSRQLLDMVKEKPFAAGGVAVGAVLMALRNPQVIATVLRTVMEAWQGAAAKGDRKKK